MACGNTNSSSDARAAAASAAAVSQPAAVRQAAVRSVTPRRSSADDGDDGPGHDSDAGSAGAGTQGATAGSDLAADWAAEYQAQTGNTLVDVQLGSFTYTFDIAAGRAVCVVGQSAAPLAARDNSRQRGHPAPEKGDHKGHLIAHSMGGQMDINIVAQNAALNLSKGWREIETIAAQNPGTAVALHLVYEGDSDRPSAIEYGLDHPDTGFQLEHFDNPPPG